MVSKLHSVKTAPGSKFVVSILLGDVTVHKWNQQERIGRALQDLRLISFVRKVAFFRSRCVTILCRLNIIKIYWSRILSGISDINRKFDNVHYASVKLGCKLGSFLLYGSAILCFLAFYFLVVINGTRPGLCRVNVSSLEYMFITWI